MIQRLTAGNLFASNLCRRDSGFIAAVTSVSSYIAEIDSQQSRRLGYALMSKLRLSVGLIAVGARMAESERRQFRTL